MSQWVPTKVKSSPRSSPQLTAPTDPDRDDLPLIAGIFFITLVAGGGLAWQAGVAGIPVALWSALRWFSFVVLVSHRCPLPDFYWSDVGWVISDRLWRAVPQRAQGCSSLRARRRLTSRGLSCADLRPASTED